MCLHEENRMKQSIKRSLLTTLLFVVVAAGILKLGGDYPTLASYMNPRLLTSILVVWIVSQGLFSVFTDSYLKKLLPWAVVLPLLWAAVFTWGYGFANLPEKKHLGDYYMYAALIFSLPYVLGVWSRRLPKARIPWGILQGLLALFLLVMPFVYVGYYVVMGGEMDMFAMMAIMATHSDEVKSFFTTVASPAMAIGSLVLIVLLLVLSMKGSFSLLKAAASCENPVKSHTGKGKIGLVLVTILFIGGFYRMFIHVFPVNIYRAVESKGSDFQVLSQMNNNINQNTGAMILQDGQNAPDGTYIVIIGESANRDHMKAFTPDYRENNTPWLSDLAKTPDFALGYKAYSNFPNTLMSLSYALTSANQYGDNDLRHVVSLVDALRKAGFVTDWISFKNRSSLSSAGVTMIAERCDHTYWEQNPDEYALNVLKELPPAKKRVVFINITGSHYTYKTRVPVSRWEQFGISPSNPDHDYDMTIAYDDWIMQNIFNYARDNMNLQAMVYFSDHGENMKHFHGTSPFYFDMVHIPFFVYLAPSYQAKYPELMKQMKAHEHTAFTNDLIFDTLSGLFQARTSFYHEAYDFSSPAYAINAENAMTMDRKKKLTEDPAF